MTAVLALAEGVADRMFELSIVGAHARLLLIIPLFFACESWVAPQMTVFVRALADFGVVSMATRPRLEAEVQRIRRRLAAAWWPEALCLAIAIGIEVSGARIISYGDTGAYDPARPSWTAWVYFRVGLVLFQFLLFRWTWRYALWVFFLWRVSRLDLQLQPAHPDLAGGLARLADVHERFIPLVAALSVLQCAAMAEDITRGLTTVPSVYPGLALLLMVDVVLFLGPLFVFTDKLWTSRTQGMHDYMGLASRYVRDFDGKWLGPATQSEPLVGTADLQSLADLGNSVDVVRRMRFIPMGPRLWFLTAGAALVPLTPLLLLQYPFAELARRFFTRAVGL